MISYLQSEAHDVHNGVYTLEKWRIDRVHILVKEMVDRVHTLKKERVDRADTRADRVHSLR